MSPFLLALGNREELVRNGKLTSIIFVRDVNNKGQEVSGYIDYAHRLRSASFEPYFERRKKVGTGGGARECMCVHMYVCCTQERGSPHAGHRRVILICCSALLWCLSVRCPLRAAHAETHGLELLQLGDPNVHFKLYAELSGEVLLEVFQGYFVYYT